MVSFREKWLTLDALCHAKFANHHCWFDALELIMQTSLLVCFLFNKYFTDSDESISLDRLGECQTLYAIKNHLVLVVIDYTFKE